MVKYEVIVLAYRNMSISDPPRMSLTALVPVHEKTMFEWVIDAVRSSSRVTSITVIGPDEIDSLLCVRYVERRIPTLTAALDFFLQLSRDLSMQSESRSRYLIIPSEAIFLTGPVIDKIILSFENDRSEIAIPVVTPERLSRFQSMIRSTIRHEGKTFVPGIFAIAKNVSYISAAFRKLIEVHRDRDLFRDLGYIPFISGAEEQQGVRTEIRFRYIETEDIQVAQIVQNQDDLELASRILPKPYIPPFSKVKVILNPHSAAGTQIPRTVQNLLEKYSKSRDLPTSLEDYKRRIVFYLSELGITSEIILTKSSDEASRIARKCADDHYDLVIAAGGDGTINAVVNGIANSSTALGILPLGSINVLAVIMDIPTELRAACQTIGRGKIRTIDLGKANERYFSSLLGVGLDAYVIKHVNSKLRRIVGSAAYILTGLSNLLKYRFKTIHLSIDDQLVKRTGYLVVIGNGKYYSANMIISPQAKVDDGLLDIVIFKSRNVFRFITYFWKLRTGNLTDLPDVEFFQGKHIVIDQYGNHFVHIDGESFGHTPVEIKVVPSALKVVC